MTVIEETDKWIIRTSDRGTFKQCREKWNFTSKIRMDYEYSPGIEALDFGIAMHAGAEVFYDPATWDGPMSVKVAGAKVAFMAHMHEWRARLKVANQWEAQQDKWDELVELGHGMIDHYALWSPPHDKKYRPIKVEIEFEVPIPCPDVDLPSSFGRDEHGMLTCIRGGAMRPVVYQGRIDLIFEDIETGELWILDHKTAAQFGQTEHLELDQQCGSYYWACKKILGLDIAGVIYSEWRKKVPKEPDVLKSGMLSQNKAQNTTPEMYRKKIQELGQSEEYYADFLQTLNDEGQMFFRRIHVHRSTDELAALEANIVNEAIDMIDNPRIYPNPSRWNCNGCAFRTPCLCKQEGGDYQWLLDNSPLYIKRS